MTFFIQRNLFWFGILLCCIAGGCSQVKRGSPQIAPIEVQKTGIAKQQTTEEEKFIHTVKWKGESLYRISLWYTGSGENWPSVAEANPSINASQIQIGDSIVIPQKILKKHTPMPKDFQTQAFNKPEKPIEPSVQLTTTPIEVELFGPIDTDPQPVEKEINDSPLPLETLD